MPRVETVSVGAYVSVGTRHETPEDNGVSHFLEHMAFKGTKRRSALRIAEEIEDVGGYINAYTSREMTAYYARVLQADVALALDVIADIVLNPAFVKKEIEVERHVILQEIGQALDTPDDIIFDWLQEASYPDQSFGRTILGPSEKVAKFNRADLQGFVKENYGPAQMILAAAGGVDHDAIVKQAEALFGGLRAQPQRAFQAATFQGSERREIKDLEQAHFAMAFDAPGYRHPDVYTAQVYAMAMGGGMSSRLFQKIREERGLCYSIFAQSGAYEDAGQITLYAGTSAEEIGDLATLTIDEMKRAADDMSEAEVARARAQIKAGMLMGLESPSSRAERIARLLAIYGRVPEVSEAVARIDAVSTADVRRYAGDVTGAGAALALYGPVDRAPSLEAIRQRLAA
jgi:predicted Zn-dependent peptidase